MVKASKLFKAIKPELRIDFGCGPNKKEGFIGVDAIKFPNVDLVLDVSEKFKESEYGKAKELGLHIGDFKPWPWKDGTVIEAHASHFIEHLDAWQRVHFVNELYRVMAPGAKMLAITPHWASNRAYGDPTHVWPPVSEMWFMYLNKEWRKSQAPHTDIEFNSKGFNCDFEVTSGYSMRGDLLVKNQEYQQFALMNYKEVAQDMIATFIKK